MNWGGFAGGLAMGLQNSGKMWKDIRDTIRENKLEDLRAKGMEEAETQRQRSIQDMIKERGVDETPTSGPVTTDTPTVEEPQAAPVAATEQATAATPSEATSSPTARPDPAAANTAAALMPSTVDAAAPVAQAEPGPTTPESASTPAIEEAKPSIVSPQAAATGGIPEVRAAELKTPKADTTVVAAKGPSGGFVVNGQRFETREQARAAAEKAAPTKEELFIKNAGPSIRERYIINGDLKGAEEWQKFADSTKGRKVMKDWAAAYTAPDFDTAVNRFGKYYTDHIDDGVDYVGHKLVKKDDGTQVAMVELKDKATGKTSQMELTKDKMLALGGSNNPQQFFENERARSATAEKMKADAAIKREARLEKAQDEAAKDERKVKLEGVKSANKAQEINIMQDRLDARESIKAKLGIDEAKGKQQAGIDTKIDALLGAGYTPDDVKQWMPIIIGLGDSSVYKKTTDPAERRALIFDSLSKNDVMFTRLSKDEQRKKINDSMDIIANNLGANAGEAKQAGSTNAKREDPSKFPIATTPMTYDKNLPVKFRKEDGKPYHFKDGQYIPIQGGVPTK